MPIITTNSSRFKSFVYIMLNGFTVLFQPIWFNISQLSAHSLNVKLFYLIKEWDPIKCFHSGPEWTREQWQSRVHHIPQSSSITGVSPSDFLVSYLWHWLVGGSYPSVEMQSIYSTAPANWALEATRSPQIYNCVQSTDYI